MVIRPGQDWGELGDPPVTSRVAGDEAEAGLLWQDGLREAVLAHGSLRRATGTEGSPPRLRARVDAVLVEFDGREGRGEQILFGSMAVSIGPRGTSIAAIVTNSGFWRGRRAVPGAHPNDGALDVLLVSHEMTALQRIMAWRRSKRFDHLPHPHLRVVRGPSWTWDDGPCRIVVDGVVHRNIDRIHCTVVPDAMLLWL